MNEVQMNTTNGVGYVSVSPANTGGSPITAKINAIEILVQDIEGKSLRLQSAFVSTDSNGLERDVGISQDRGYVNNNLEKIHNMLLDINNRLEQVCINAE